MLSDFVYHKCKRFTVFKPTKKNGPYHQVSYVNGLSLVHAIDQVEMERFRGDEKIIFENKYQQAINELGKSNG